VRIRERPPYEIAEGKNKMLQRSQQRNVIAERIAAAD
jgi:hypothetical protein